LIERVIQNLLTTQLNYTGKNGHILTTEKCLHNVKITITDNGIGIPDRERIFASI
jgi:signal transduction histidine kinase